MSSGKNHKVRCPVMMMMMIGVLVVMESGGFDDGGDGFDVIWIRFGYLSHVVCFACLCACLLKFNCLCFFVLSVCLFLCLSVCLSLCLSVCLFVCLCLYKCLSAWLFVIAASHFIICSE